MSERISTVETSGALRRLETVFSRYSPELYRYVLRRLRHPADAADLTQEIFERFIRGEGLGKARDPRAFLFTIAANVVIDARAAQDKAVVTYDSPICDAAAATLPENSDAFEQMGLAQELTAALAELPDMHRAAFLLTKWDGLSIKEAAMRLNLTEGSVMVYVCEARAKLRIILRNTRG